MLDIGWQELLIIAVLTVIVVGPKDLPQALRTVTAVLRKARGLAREFQNGVDDMIREAELDDVKRQVNSARRLDLDAEARKIVDPAGTLTEDFDPAEFARDIKHRVEGVSAAQTAPVPAAAPAASASLAAPPAPREAEPADPPQPRS